MQLKKIVSLTKFNKISDTYMRRTGLPLVLVNSDGKIIHTQSRCTLCEELLENGDSVLEKSCQIKMLKAVEEAYRWGEGYITNCPLGLIMFAVPIVSDKKLIGGFLSGFAIFPEMKKDFVEEISQNLMNFFELVDEMKLKKMKLKVFSSKKARENVSLLLMLTRKFHINDLHFLEDRKEKYIQHYKIANFLDDLKKNKPDISRKILDKQDEIIQKVKLGDKTGAREILNEFLGSIFFDSGMNFEIIKVRIIELIVIISRTAIEAGVEVKELMGLNYSYLTELNKATDIDELLFKLNDILTNFINKVSATKDKKKKIKIRKMIEYINQNFTKKLKSEEIAKSGDLSISRCLHLFKEETGLSLSQYIKKLRVDYGKYLLLNTDISLADCAVEAGFYDQSHFTKTFSQIERMTPSRFRQKYKRLEWQSHSTEGS
jgi:AraC-like DNA-binding protein/ligand-binding sensor protein